MFCDEFCLCYIFKMVVSVNLCICSYYECDCTPVCFDNEIPTGTFIVNNFFILSAWTDCVYLEIALFITKSGCFSINSLRMSIFFIFVLTRDVGPTITFGK